MSWSLFGALSAVIGKRTMPEPIKKLLYETEDEIDNLVQSESDMEVITGSKKGLAEMFSEQYFMDKFYGAVGWVDKGILRRSKWKGYENIFTENDWKQNKTFDQITDDENLMDEFTDSEQSMDDSINSEVAMDKVTDSEIAMDKVMADVMPRTKMLLSQWILDAMWSKEMASEKFWDTGQFDDEFPGGDTWDAGIKDDTDKGKVIYLYLQTGGHDNEERAGWSINLDLTHVSLLNVYTTHLLEERENRVGVGIFINGDEVFYHHALHDWTDRSIDTKNYSGECEIELVMNTTYDYLSREIELRFAQIRLEG